MRVCRRAANMPMQPASGNGVIGMRLAVFLLFLALVFATVSAPAAAQVPVVAPPDVEKPDKPGKDKNANKPGKGGEDCDPEGEEGDPEGEDCDPEGDEGDPPAEEGDPPGEEGDPPAEEGDPPGDEGSAPEGEEGDTGGASGSGESGGGPGGQDPAGLDRSTSGSGSANEGGSSSVVRQAGCPEECDLPGALTDGGEGEAILSSADVEATSGLTDEGLAVAGAADASPPVLALFALMALGLLVGLAGGLRALHGRLSGGPLPPPG